MASETDNTAITNDSEISPGTGEGLTARKPLDRMKILSVISLVVVTAIYFLRLDRVVGMMIDDAWYVLLAKALATGQGYTLINSPTQGILPLYPPGFPLLLSLFYRISPDFPGNLWLLKSVSMMAMIFVGILTYRYFLRVRQLPASVALGIAVATTLCPALVFLASSTVMSDCVFMLFFMLTVVVTEKCKEARQTSRAWIYALLSAAMASYTFLVRSIAIALIAAVFFYFLKERLIRSAIIFSIAAALFSGPWMIYTRIHTPTPEQQLEQGGNMVLPYGIQFWQRLAGDPASGEISASGLPRRVFDNTTGILGRDVSRILLTVIFEALRNPYQEAEKLAKEGFVKYGDTIWFSFLLAVFMIIGFISAARERLTFTEIAIPMMIGIIVLWPFETFRYVLPMAQFFVFYFLIGLRSTQSFIRQRITKGRSQVGWGLVHAALIVMIAIHLYGNIGRIIALNDTSSIEKPIWNAKFAEAELLFGRLEQVAKKTDVIVSTNPALVTLFTGHKTVGLSDPELRWETWKRIPVRYMVWLTIYPIPRPTLENLFRTVYISRDGSLFRIIDLGDPRSRPDWKLPAPN